MTLSGKSEPETAAPSEFRVRKLSVHSAKRTLIRNVDLDIPAKCVFGIIGPSGAGKSTLLRCLNRLIDLTISLRVEGEIWFRDQSIFKSDVDVDGLRARVGMLFQQPVIFPKSIMANTIFGIRHLGRIPRKQWNDAAENALREAALWDEVKDRLDESALRLSVGQQQRLCLARTLAVKPDVILMDEPTSALDAKSTEAIEELILKLKPERTIVLVTHNLGQARRVSDRIARLALRDLAGEVVQCGHPHEILSELNGGLELTS